MHTTIATQTPRFRLTPRARKSVVAVHVVSSVGWLGITAANLVLLVVGLTTADPARQHAALLAMAMVGETLLIPVSLAAFTSGLVLSLGTKWGLFRHWWVVVKFALTLIAVVLTPLSSVPGLRDLAAAVSATPAGQLTDTGEFAVGLLSAGCVSSAMYLTCVVLTAFKPGGRTRFARRR
ncbi:hypothetical protein [Amycolatopsis albispora]|uniref:DUF2269 domain-containing protein n=1 Tax=Amycolatopsis albispora TaxID=1804986 RepID=A0A344L207_9PSEU|nr:hypothetical protein [Amycolatopsis albispora]AXB42081.1 hypothetical protein A4R43_05690 [Amycolatopsis albispora]